MAPLTESKINFFATETSGSAPLGNPRAFFDLVQEKFQKAAERVGLTERFFQVGEEILCLRFAGSGLVEDVTAALNHLRPPGPVKATLTVDCWDSESTGIKMPPPPWDPGAQTVRGDIRGFNDSRFVTAFCMYDEVLYLLDRESRRGFMWTQDAKSLPFYFAGSPIRPVLSWCAEMGGAQLIHAAGIGTENGGVLITGRSGSGKSTTSLLCLAAGFLYAGDDYVGVSVKSDPVMHSLYNTAKIERPRLSDFCRLIEKSRLGETPPDQKATVFFDKHRVPQLRTTLPLRAILCGKITGLPTTSIHRIPGLEAAKAMAPTTIAQLPGSGEWTLKMIGDITQRVPCFQINLGLDLPHIPEVIAAFLREGGLR